MRFVRFFFFTEIFSIKKLIGVYICGLGGGGGVWVQQKTN